MKSEYFNNHFKSIRKEIKFNPQWNNGTGYLDDLVHVKFLNNGEVAKTTMPDRRRAIIVGTRYGNCVFFERHVPMLNAEEYIIVSNVPTRLTNIITSGSLSYDEFCRLACEHINIGKAIEALHSDNPRYVDEEEMYEASEVVEII